MYDGSSKCSLPYIEIYTSFMKTVPVMSVGKHDNREELTVPLLSMSPLASYESGDEDED